MKSPAAGALNVMGDNLAARSGADTDSLPECESANGDLEFTALIRKTDPSWRH